MTPSEPRCRFAGPSDRAAVCALWAALQRYHVERAPEIFRDLPEEWMESCYQHYLASAWHSVLVAECDGRIVGFALLGIEDPTHPGFLPIRRGLVYELMVDEAHRGRGIGRRLLREGEAWAKLQGAVELALYVFEVNAEAQKFYAATGWRTEVRRLIRKIA